MPTPAGTAMLTVAYDAALLDVPDEEEEWQSVEDPFESLHLLVTLASAYDDQDDSDYDEEDILPEEADSATADASTEVREEIDAGLRILEQSIITCYGALEFEFNSSSSVMRLLRFIVKKFEITSLMRCILHLDAGGYVLVNSAIRSVICEQLGTGFPLNTFLPFPGTWALTQGLFHTVWKVLLLAPFRLDYNLMAFFWSAGRSGVSRLRMHLPPQKQISSGILNAKPR